MDTMEKRLVEQRMMRLHAEAAHARLVKEARGAQPARRGPSRASRLLAAIRGTRKAVRPAQTAVRPTPAKRITAGGIIGT